MAITKLDWYNTKLALGKIVISVPDSFSIPEFLLRISLAVFVACRLV